MRDFQFIHSQEDVKGILAIAAEMELAIRADHPVPRPILDIVSVLRIPEITSGVFTLFRPEWFFGEPQFLKIDSGLNKGMYSLSPRINQVGITLYLSGERRELSRSRFGSGFLSRDLEWYSTIDRTTHSAPEDVKTTFDSILDRIDTSKRVSGGGMKFTVLSGAWQKLLKSETLPPFEFIEWPPR